MLQELCQIGYFEGGIDAIERGGSDTSGVAGSFTARVEQGCAYRLQGIRITRDTNRTTATTLHAEDHCIVRQEARELAIKIPESLLEAFTDMRR